MSYWRFFAMIGTSTVVMFGLMYLNTYLWPHALYSETRAYMAVLMGAVMAVAAKVVEVTARSDALGCSPVALDGRPEDEHVEQEVNNLAAPRLRPDKAAT